MFRPLLLERFRTMVRLGLARSRVQPFLEKKPSVISHQVEQVYLMADG
jgi:hypothetical protein